VARRACSFLFGSSAKFVGCLDLDYGGKVPYNAINLKKKPLSFSWLQLAL
jgi:hypothetical protein